MKFNDKQKLVKIISNYILCGKRSIMLSDKEIFLPTPQKYGSFFQRETYATLKAEEIVEAI